MPLYIRDDKVDRLAVEVMRLTGAKTKTDAVREALRLQLSRVQDDLPLRDRIAPLQRDIATLGRRDPEFDMKRFTDELWSEA